MNVFRSVISINYCGAICLLFFIEKFSLCHKYFFKYFFFIILRLKCQWLKKNFFQLFLASIQCLFFKKNKHTMNVKMCCSYHENVRVQNLKAKDTNFPTQGNITSIERKKVILLLSPRYCIH